MDSKQKDEGLVLFQEAMMKLRTGLPPAEDFQSRSLDLMMKRLSNYRCRPMPTAPPIVEEFHQKTKEDQKELADNKGFFRQAAAYAWLMECDKIAGLNRGNHGLLKDALSLPCTTQEEKQAIRKMMAEFTDFYAKECERAGYRPLIKEEPQEQGEEVVLDQEALNAVSLFDGSINP